MHLLLGDREAQLKLGSLSDPRPSHDQSAMVRVKYWFRSQFR